MFRLLKYCLSLVICSIGFSSCIHSLNAYTEGSAWLCEGITDDWPFKNFHETFFIKGDTVIANKKYLKLYRKYLSKSAIYECGIRTEYNKVFFAPKNHEWDLLIFDYNITPGDVVKVYSTSVGYYGDICPLPIEMKCFGMSKMESCGITYDVFSMSSLINKDVGNNGTEKWIKGIGSEVGPIENDYMQSAGGGSSVYEILMNGKRIWKDSITLNRINKNTIWKNPIYYK